NQEKITIRAIPCESLCSVPLFVVDTALHVTPSKVHQSCRVFSVNQHIDTFAVRSVPLRMCGATLSNSRARICEFTFLRAFTSLLVSSEFVLLAARLRDERLFHMVFERLDHPSKGFVMEHVTDNFLFAFENLQALEVVRFKFRRVLKLERKEVEANEVTLTSHVVAGVPVPVA
ncbi:hypothetical protein BN1708_008632, partial [Verticillium longisporum]